MAYGKLIGAKMYEAPNVLVKDGKQYVNPPEALYLEQGYLPLEYTTIPDMIKGYHLVQSWIDMSNRLVQKWNYEKDDISEYQKRINELEDILSSLKEKTSTQDFPEGDYMNPIHLMEGGLITIKNKWYYVNDKDRPHRAIIEGFATEKVFNDRTWFYFV